MSKDEGNNGKEHKPRRVLGEEWVDWDGGKEPADIDEGKKTFILLSLLVIVFVFTVGALFWYLVLPRFLSFGRIWAFSLSIVFLSVTVILLAWYILLVVTVFTKKSYMKICLTRGSSLFFFLYPLAIRFASLLGISRDRLSHSFIRVSNTLIRPDRGNGPVLAIFPRCLDRETRTKAREICESHSDVIIHTASGGSAARKVIRDLVPRAIVAVACERDLVSGIQDIAPRIPVIGIPNNRPSGPCKDTTMDIRSFLDAIEFFSPTP
ncbi:MAG: DUF116 domain-containing protein [Bacteroidales bacterium]|nr:DUF116 domain-containing protein [Candidatus Latescibacterota bacterium]